MAGKFQKPQSKLARGVSSAIKNIFGGGAGASMGDALMGGPKPKVKTRSGAGGGPKRVKARK